MELTLFEPRDLLRTLRDEVWPSMSRLTMLGTFGADLVELEDDVLLLADLPGVRREDLDVSLERNVLTISGERRSPETDGRARYYLAERERGRFSRSFALPCEVERDSVDATLADGVLAVRVRKSERSRRRRIDVRTGEVQGRLAAGAA